MSKIFVLLSIWMQVSLLYGWTVPELQKKMEDSSINLNTLSCEYLHEVRSSLTDEFTSVKGIAYFKKPNEFRIEQKEPDEQLFITSGQHIYIYTPRFNQVVRDSRESWLKNNFFFRALSSARGNIDHLIKDYEWKIDGKRMFDGEETIQLTLQKKEPSIQEQESIILWISGLDYLPRKSEVKNGTVTVSTVLLSLSKNPDLPRNLFRFKKPARSKEIHLN